MYELRTLYISVTNPKGADLKTLGIDGRMNLEEIGCKGMDSINLLRIGMVATSSEPLDFVLCVFFLCIEAFLRDLMNSDLHTINMHIPTLCLCYMDL
jgi:hypothetical protein